MALSSHYPKSQWLTLFCGSSCISPLALDGQDKVAEAFAESSDIVTFIPSKYTQSWAPSDFETNPTLGQINQDMSTALNRAKESGLGTTFVVAGVVDEWIFTFP